MAKKSQNDIYVKAVRLAEGGIVECGGHFVKAKEVKDVLFSCEACNMDSACDMDMCNLCAEVDGYTHSTHILQFAYE